MTHPRSSLAPLFTSRRAIDEVKRDGWRETGTLAVSADDTPLDAFERQFVLNLGNRLYGPRKGDERRDGGAAIECGDDLAHALRSSQGGGDKPFALIASGGADPVATAIRVLESDPDADLDALVEALAAAGVSLRHGRRGRWFCAEHKANDEHAAADAAPPTPQSDREPVQPKQGKLF